MRIYRQIGLASMSYPAGARLSVRWSRRFGGGQGGEKVVRRCLRGEWGVLYSRDERCNNFKGLFLRSAACLQEVQQFAWVFEYSGAPMGQAYAWGLLCWSWGV